MFLSIMEEQLQFAVGRMPYTGEPFLAELTSIWTVRWLTGEDDILTFLLQKGEKPLGLR